MTPPRCRDASIRSNDRNTGATSLSTRSTRSLSPFGDTVALEARVPLWKARRQKLGLILFQEKGIFRRFGFRMSKMG